MQLALYLRFGNGAFRGWGRYVVRRCRRILPPYYACLAISLIVCFAVTMRQPGRPFTQYLPITTPVVLSHVFLVHNLSQAWMYKINGVLWSIAIEFQLYFLFPLMVALAEKLGRIVLLVACAVLAWALLMNVPGGAKLYFWYIPLFALGMVAARTACDPKRVMPNWALFLAAAGLFVAACMTAAARKDLIWADALVGASAATLMIALVQHRGSLLDRVLGCKPLGWIGGFSYSLYLMHHPLLQTWYVTRPLGWVSMGAGFKWNLLGLPLIVAGCYLFHLAFERPFMGSPRKPTA